MEDMIVAKTILEQLGGNKFRAMTGAKDFVGSANSLSFKIGRNTNSINAVKVEYDSGADLYNMIFMQVSNSQTKGVRVKQVKKYEGVYFDSLQDIFTTETGMYTHL